MVKHLLGATLLASVAFSSAHALPAFTFSPSAVGLAGSSFTADNFIIGNYSTISFNSAPNTVTSSSFSDTGFLTLTQGQLNGTQVSTPNLFSTNGYGLYIQFSATGTENPIAANGTATGSFTGGTFTLYGFNEGSSTPTFSPDGTTTTNVTGAIQLATGTIIGGNVVANFGTTPPQPSAFPLGTFVVTSADSAFFNSPTPFYPYLSASFTQNAQVSSTTTGFTINGGGGNLNFVPEPATFALLGAGLVGLAFARRRRG